MSNVIPRLAGKVVFITGAASGIGSAIARRCIVEGASVICADHSTEGALALAGELGRSAIGLSCDVTDGRSVKAAVEIGLCAGHQPTRCALRIMILGASICPFITPSPALGSVGESRILWTTSIPSRTWPNTAKP